jgi:hypothetical protein
MLWLQRKMATAESPDDIRMSSTAPTSRSPQSRIQRSLYLHHSLSIEQAMDLLLSTNELQDLAQASAYILSALAEDRMSHSPTAYIVSRTLQLHAYTKEAHVPICLGN